MKEYQNDIKRLGRVITLLKKIEDIIYHMDKNEYDRFRTYIDSRESISFPFKKKEVTE